MSLEEDGIHNDCYCKYYPFINEIIPNLYVGNWNSSDFEYLFPRNIRTVVSLEDTYYYNFPENWNINHLHIYLSDDGIVHNYEEKTKISYIKHINKVVDFIHKGLEHNDGVLVHCLCGINRSITTIIAYLIKYHKHTYESGFQLVKIHRTIAEPNQKMQEIIKNWSKTIS